MVKWGVDLESVRVLFEGEEKGVKNKAIVAIVVVLLVAVLGVTMYATNRKMQAEYEANVEDFNRGADSLR